MGNELIKVREESGRQLVSARELHEFLGSKKHMTQWMKPYISDDNDYGFIENIDYQRIDVGVNPTNGLPLTDYALTISMAKELSMLSKCENGKRARLYFIECEKKLKEIALPSYMISDSIQRAERWIEEERVRQQLQLENKQQKQIIMEYEPKVSYYDMILNAKGTMTITQIAKDYGLSACEMNKKLHELGIQYKQSDTWLLYSKYAKFGYTQSKPHMYENSNGDKCTKLNTKWTQKGRLFLYEELKRNGVVPNIEKNN